MDILIVFYEFTLPATFGVGVTFFFLIIKNPTQTLFLVSAVLKTICWWRNEWLFIRQTSSKFKWIAQDQPCTYWLDWVQTHIRVSSNPAHTLQYAGNLRHLSTANRFLGEERGCKGNKLDWHSNSVRSSRVFAEMPLCLRCGTEPVPALLGFFFW